MQRAGVRVLVDERLGVGKHAVWDGRNDGMRKRGQGSITTGWRQEGSRKDELW
jgi:hypothetical protein